MSENCTDSVKMALYAHCTCLPEYSAATQLELPVYTRDRHGLASVRGWWGAKHVAIGSSPATAAATPPLFACSFSFSPPAAPLELNSHVVYGDASLHSLKPLHFRLSLVTLGVCSAKQFSRPSAQLAGSLVCPCLRNEEARWKGTNVETIVSSISY